MADVCADPYECARCRWMPAAAPARKGGHLRLCPDHLVLSRAEPVRALPFGSSPEYVPASARPETKPEPPREPLPDRRPLPSRYNTVTYTGE